MDEVREKQERLARLHFDLDSEELKRLRQLNFVILLYISL